jgi:hypothetical protein
MDEDGQFVLTNRIEANSRAERAHAEKQKTLEQQWRANIEKERARIEEEKRRLTEEKELLAQRRELELEKRNIEREKLRLAQEAEKDRLEAGSRASTPEGKKIQSASEGQVAALSAPVSRPDGRLPLKIALLPWKMRTEMGGSAPQIISERTAFNQILKTVGEDSRFTVSHSYYAFEPPSGGAHHSVPPLTLGREEAEALWKKSGVFARSEPNVEATLSLAKRIPFDLAVFIDTYSLSGTTQALLLTLVDVASGQAWTVEKDIEYSVFEEEIHDTLKDQLKQVLRDRES